MQGIALANLAPKLRQIASVRKKQRKRNELGYLKCVLKFDLTSTVLVLRVNEIFAKTRWGVIICPLQCAS